MPEQDLIQRLQTGDSKAFKELVDVYQHRLYNTVLGLVQNEKDAEDVTQEVFVKVYQSIKQFKGEAALSTWLYRIAVTQALDFIRRQKRQKRGGFIRLFF